MSNAGLDFGHIKKTLGTFINMVAGVFLGEGGEESSASAGDGKSVDEEKSEDAGEEVFRSEHWSHYGFDSRPHSEDEMGRCEVIFSRDQNVTICTKDRRYRINLADGEVGIYTGKDGQVTCKQILKPDGTIVVNGKNLGIMVEKKDDEGGDVMVGAQNSVTLSRVADKTSTITLNKKGGIQMLTGGGGHITMEDNTMGGKTTVQTDGAAMYLTGDITGVKGKAELNAPNISLVGTVSVGTSPVQMPVAVMGCMAGPFPIATGSMSLWAQFP